MSLSNRIWNPSFVGWIGIFFTSVVFVLAISPFRSFLTLGEEEEEDEEKKDEGKKKWRKYCDTE